MTPTAYLARPAASLRFVSYGVSLELWSDTPATLTLVRPHLPPGWRPAARPKPVRRYTILGQSTAPGAPHNGMYSLWADETRLAQAEHLSVILKRFETESRLYIAEMTQQRVFIHAGVVGWRGRAIVIPGRSYTGKTTLVASLLRAGATYFSDEYAVFDRQGRVYPYPKPLALRDAVTGEQTDTPVEALGARLARRPLPLGLVLVTPYQPGAVWSPEPLSLSDGVLALADNAIAIRRAPEFVLPVLAAAVARATVLSGPRGDAVQVVAYLAEQPVP